MTSRDTSPDARDVQLRVLREMGGARRVRMAFEMSEQARAIAIAGVLAREPHLTEAEARARVLRAILGDALYEAAYGGAKG